MSAPQIDVLANPDALANRAAAEWLKALPAAKERGRPYCVALSGGRIAKHFLCAVAALAKAGQTSGPERPTTRPDPSGLFQGWIHFFWGDERCVPPDDPESNFALARECLLEPLAIPAGQIHRIRGEAPPEEAAAEAETELRRFAPLGQGGQPVLDMVFLGMGEEGHVASLFPGEAEAVLSGPQIYRPVTTPKPPPRRITLGYPGIAAAGQVWVLASGPGKAGALRGSLGPSGNTPLARVLKMRKHTRIFTDIQIGPPPSG